MEDAVQGGTRIQGKLKTLAGAQKRGSAANRTRAIDRAADLAPTIAQIRATGATTLKAIADRLNGEGIPTPRGQGKRSAVQVKRTLEALREARR